MVRHLYPGFPGGRVGLGLFVLRVVVGAAFIFHGWPKIQHPTDWMHPPLTPQPAVMQVLAAVAEFGGGIALILGLLTPLAALLIAGNMVVALATFHLPAGHAFVSTQGPSFEPAAFYLATMILLLLTGPGALSIDAQLFRRRDSAT